MQSYTIFYNNARLLIAWREQNYITEEHPENCYWYHHSLNLRDVFSEFQSSGQDLALFYTKPMDAVQIKIGLYYSFDIEEAAGGIVLKDNAMLSIFRFNRWDFPKGHIEKGELATDAALREVEEETGIDNLIITKELDFTYHVYKNEHDRFTLKETHWFLMRTTSEKTPVPQTEEGISAVEWIPLSQRSKIIENTYPSIIELLERL
jgi:ADP-ribose pyrophosphatase YjhB (NUDIX family)